MISEQLSLLFFWLAIAVYICSFIFYMAKIKLPSWSYLHWATAFLVGGLISNTISLLFRYLVLGGFSGAGFFEIFLIISWFVVVEALVVEVWSKVRILGLYASLLAIVLLLAGWSRYTVPRHIFQNIKSIWVLVHVVLIVIAYSAFFVAAGAAVFYLLQERQLKSKKLGALQRFLPSLEVLDEAAYRSIVSGFIIFTIAIALGFGAALQFWKLKWDVNIVVASLATWLMYLFYLFSRFKIGWVGKKSSYVAIAGLIPVALTSLITLLTKLQ